jgi:hypothetical protein
MSRAFMRKRNTFRPTDIGGCQLWLDAADATTLTLSGSTVIQWRDKVINLQLSVGSGTNTLTQNAFGNMQAILFNGGYLLSPSNVFTATENVNYITQFIIMKQTVNTPYGLVAGIGFYTQNTKNSLYINQNQAQIVVRRGFTSNSSRYDGPLYANTINQGYIYSALTDYQASTFQLIINGTTNAPTAFAGTGTTTSDSSVIYVGSTSFNEPFYGYVAEYIIYNTSLTDPQRQQVEAYLSQKWGLRQQIPQSHPGTTGIVYSQQSIPKALSLPYPVIFTPLQIQPGSCQLWLDGADPAGTGIVPANGTVLTSWIDKSGKSKNATGVNSPTVVTSAVNSLSVVSYNGSSYSYSSIAAGSFSSGMVIFIVYKVNGIVTYCAPITRTIGNMGYPIDQYNSVRYMGGPGGIAGGGSSWSHASATSTTLFTQIILTSGNILSEYVNGTSETVTGAFPYSDTASFVYIGTRDDKVTSFNGYMCEAIVYNAVFTTPQQQQVEGYLASKWGLQANLPANHPYKNSSANISNARGISRPVGLPPRSNIAFPRLKIIASIDTPSATLSSLTSTGATVTWSEISGAISYTVTIYYNSSASVTTSNLQVAQSPYTLATSGSIFTFTATDTTYYAATVTAINATAQATSSISSPVLYTAPPGQATTNTPTNTGTTLNMSWSAASGSVTAYTVYVLAGGSLAPSGTLSLGNVTSTTFSPMVSGTVYSFYVVATGPGGSGTQSTTSSTVTYTAVPVAPTSITLASLTATGATVTWSGGSGATYFTCQIYSSASSNMSSPSIISPQTPNSSTSVTTPQVFTFSVTAGLYYGAIITAVNAGGSTSSAMSTGVLYSVAEPPVAPTTVTLASLTGSGATVTWSGGSGATYYTCQIYSSAASNMSSPTTISQSPSSSSSVSSGQVFSFSVEDSLYYGAIVTTVNASGSAASSMSTGVQFVGTYSGLGPVTTLATGFGNLYNLAIDSAENIYLADYGGHKVWRIPSGGSPSIFAGSTFGYLDGAAGSAKFNGPSGVAVSSDGATVYVTDYGNSKIRRINGGTVTTLAGGTHGAWVDGASNVARFFYPSGIAIDRTETVLFIGDKLTHRIRVVTIATGAVTTLAGGLNSTVGTSGSFADGTGSNASFNSPLGVCVGLDNSVYVADSTNQRIRKVTYPEGVVTTVAGDGTNAFLNGTGTGARFSGPFGVAMDSYGILYVADKDSKRIRQITRTGVVTTFAGTGTNTNVDNANRLLATFVQPTGVVVNSSRTSLYVTQTATPAVRKITLS